MRLKNQKLPQTASGQFTHRFHKTEKDSIYNDQSILPDRVDLKLSDAFMTPVNGYEFTAHMININVSHNRELLEKCPALMGYATLVKYSRENLTKGMKNEEAVDNAVRRCIDEGILKDYLLKKRSEAVRMFLTEFDEDTWRESMREEGKEEGQKESADLINFLWSNGREEDALKASSDKDFFNKLLAEFKSGMLTAK